MSSTVWISDFHDRHLLTRKPGHFGASFLGLKCCWCYICQSLQLWSNVEKTRPFCDEVHQPSKTRVEAGVCGAAQREQEVHLLHQQCQGGRSTNQSSTLGSSWSSIICKARQNIRRFAGESEEGHHNSATGRTWGCSAYQVHISNQHHQYQGHIRWFNNTFWHSLHLSIFEKEKPRVTVEI